MNEKLIWSTEKRLVSDLINLKKNPRKITENAFNKLKERIIQRGFHDVIKIDIDNTILSGNQRKRALTDLGITEVNVLVSNRKLTNDEVDIIVLESNRNDGEFDFEILANEFDMGILKDVGFSEIELGFNIDKIASDLIDEDKESKEVTCPNCKTIFKA